jgi:hypothetical protein
MGAQQRNDAATQRRVQLKRWIDELFEGSQAAFIASTNDGKTQINQGELSGLLKEKSFGEKRARRLELQAGMPAGYLDSNVGPQRAAQSGKSYVAQEPQPGTVTLSAERAMRWPFHSVTYGRLMDLKHVLGPKAGSEALRELDRFLDAMVSKFEHEAAAKKRSGTR